MKRVSEAIPKWRKELPAIQPLVPWSRARLCARFMTMPPNPDSDRLQAAFYEWGMRTGLYTAETASALAKTRMGHLVYWLAPLASQDVLWLIGTFNLWVIAVDDALAERGAPLDDLMHACDDVLRRGKTKAALNPASRFFLELRERITALGCAELIPQIADQVRISFLDWKREQRYLKEDNLPSLPDYLKLRVGNPCLYGPMLTQRCDKGMLPPKERFCERLDKICQLVNVMVSLNGDILGFQRDIEAEFPINVIPVIALDFDVDLVTAYRMSHDLVDLYKSVMDAMVADVYINPGPNPEAATQAHAMAHWVDGFHTWHMTSPRHGFEKPTADGKLAGQVPADFREGPLWQALSARDAEAAQPSAEPRQLSTPSGLGSSAARIARPRPATPRLPARPEDWALGLLGWHAPVAEPSSAVVIATPGSARFSSGPTGLGTSAARVSRRPQSHP